MSSLIVRTQSVLPSDIANLIAWWRSDLGITLNGSTVSAWADQSGSGFHLTQPTANIQPNYDQKSYNLPVLTFVRANAQLLSRANTNLFGTGPLTVFMATRLQATNDDVHFGAGMATAGFFLRTIGASRGILIQNVNNLQDAGVSLAGPEIWSVTYQNSLTQLRVNGASAALTNSGSTLTDAGATSTIQVSGYPASGLNDSMDLFEIVCYRRKLDALEIRTIERYMGRRYGIVVP